MGTSILNNVKKNLGVDQSDVVFDEDIITHINGVFSTLCQLGVGPEEGFRIEDSSTEWDAFLDGELRLNSVQTYMYLRVRLIFDPPATSFAIAAVQEQIKELEWRINVQREHTGWINPLPPAPEDVVYDGGEP